MLSLVRRMRRGTMVEGGRDPLVCCLAGGGSRERYRRGISCTAPSGAAPRTRRVCNVSLTSRHRVMLTANSGGPKISEQVTALRRE